jgi:hypothetical protein
MSVYCSVATRTPERGSNRLSRDPFLNRVQFETRSVSHSKLPDRRRPNPKSTGLELDAVYLTQTCLRLRTARLERDPVCRTPGCGGKATHAATASSNGSSGPSRSGRSGFRTAAEVRTAVRRTGQAGPTAPTTAAGA